jgi:hypothetical protein
MTVLVLTSPEFNHCPKDNEILQLVTIRVLYIFVPKKDVA